MSDYPHITPGHKDDRPQLKSVVFRLSLKNRDAVARTARISQSALLREAITDLLRKHAGALEGSEP